MNFSVNINNSFLYWIFVTLSVNKSWSKSLDGTCGDRQLLPPKGTIISPSYPALHSHEVSCTWHILSPPQSTLKIRIKDFDVPDDPGCDEPPCCYYNWVSLPVTDKPGIYHQYCGNINQTTISVSQIHTVIRFHYYSPPDFYHARGFHLTYSIEKRSECEDGQFSCKDGTCLQKFMKCDGTIQCSDGDDEMHCTGFSKCGKDELLCSTSSQRCFTQSELCDGVFQCPFGEDEFACAPGCERGIACLRGEGCYLPSQRCDGRSDCIDDSDESFCPDELCPKLPNKRQCHNGRCIQSRLWCDGSDDCGDFSDEEACLKNSMITIAMMGSLLGGLFLVLAVGCSLRMYSRRCSDSHNCQMHHSHPGARHRMTHSLSLPALIDNEFFHREPPPMYSVAVGNSGLPRRTRPSRSRSSSSRRHHSHRHTVAVAVPKPPSENALNNSSSPSSEDSLIASSNTPNVNSDDNEQLLTA